jgi:hypothetical protein
MGGGGRRGKGEMEGRGKDLKRDQKCVYVWGGERAGEKWWDEGTNSTLINHLG